MTPELYAALIGLAIAAIAVVATVLKWLMGKAPGYLERIFEAQVARIEMQVKQIDRKVDENTEITEKVGVQTNGLLQKARNEATKYRAIAERQARVLSEQKWLISQLQKREDGRALIDLVMQARRAVVHDGDYEDLEELLLRKVTREEHRS